MQKELIHFQNEITLKYHLYNSLFLTLPFGGTEETGRILPVFTNYCATEIIRNKSPEQIIQGFFQKQLSLMTEHDQTKIIFNILQFVERQILLFDALEDAAFTKIRNLEGPGSITQLVNKVKSRNQESNLIRQLTDYRIKIVLTAHPTQFYPDPILGIIIQLNSALRHNDLKQISQLLVQLGKTSFKHAQKPTPFQEAQSLIWFLENVFYPVIPEIHQELKDLMTNGQPLPPLEKCIELGFWPGGDRDGNPYVTPQTTVAVARLLKSSILRRYISDLKQLAQKLTFPGILEKLLLILKKVEGNYLSTQVSAEENKNSRPDIYKNVQALLTNLEELRTLLIAEHNGLFLEYLETFINKVQCFEFYFATMDLRENSRAHHEAFLFLIKELSTGENRSKLNHKLSQYDHLSTTEKLQIVTELMQSKIHYSPGSITENTPITNCLNSFAVIKQIQAENGEKGLHRYIISNTSSAFDVLELLTMLHLAGGFSGPIPIDIIPLFESITDLENAVPIMEQLYQNPVYQQHLHKRQHTQTIMLGFSDGTKDGGYVTANWSIYKAKLALTQLSEKYQIKVIFFDGRGGPPARGGGNTHQFYRSLGSKIRHRRSELTIQGQTISSNFGSHDSAKFNLEQLFTAGLEDLVFPEQANNLGDQEIQLLEQLSQISLQTYQQLKEHPLFIPYLEQVTPLQFYGDLNIGSRPAARKKTTHVQLESLRAIPFVGSWSQLKQNVPGFYGFGSALKQLIDQGEKSRLTALYQHSLFFRTLAENAMMSLSKSFFPLTAYIKKDRKFGKFWQMLADEAELTQQLLLEVSGQKQLLDNDPINRESIKLREEIVLPLLIIQQFALTKLHEIADPDSESYLIYKKMVLKALAANTNASRNSA